MSGKYASASDMDFYIDTDPKTLQEMVVVSGTVHTRQQVGTRGESEGGNGGGVRECVVCAVPCKNRVCPLLLLFIKGTVCRLGEWSQVGDHEGKSEEMVGGCMCMWAR